MALIDFRCNKCGGKFEEIVRILDRDNIKCPICGSKNIRQVFEGKCNMGGSAKGGGCSGGSCAGCRGCHGIS